MSIDFIHCNKCYVKPEADQNLKFYLTACAHVFCNRCRERANDQCYVCKKKTNVLELSQLTGVAQNMLADPLVVAKKQNHILMQVLNFQLTQRARYSSYLEEQMKRAKKLQEFAKNESKLRQMAEKEKQQLTVENSRLKDQLRHVVMAQQNRSPTPQNRRRAPQRPNDTYHGLQMNMRNGNHNHAINDTGMSLPIGASATTPADNFFGLPDGSSPYADSSQNSQDQFMFGDGTSTVANSPGMDLGVVGFPANFNQEPPNFNQGRWMNGAPPPVQQRRQNVRQAQPAQQPDVSFRMSNIARAFQGV